MSKGALISRFAMWVVLAIGLACLPGGKTWADEAHRHWITIDNHFPDTVLVIKEKSGILPESGKADSIAASATGRMPAEDGELYGVWTSREPYEKLVVFQVPENPGGRAYGPTRPLAGEDIGGFSYVVTENYMTIANFSTDNVTMFWERGPNDLVQYQTIPPLHSYVQGSYVGHKWQIVQASNPPKTFKVTMPTNLLTFPVFAGAEHRKRAAPNLVVRQDRRYDQQTYLMAHNAMASLSDGWGYFQQIQSIYNQLKYNGVRALEIDVHLFEEHPGDGFKLYLCHEHCSDGQLLGGSGATRFGLPTGLQTVDYAFREINRFMEEEPDQVVTVFIEHRNDTVPTLQANQSINQFVDQLYVNALNSSGALNKMFWIDTPRNNDTINTALGLSNITTNRIMPTLGGQETWPLVRDMRRKLVVFIDDQSRDALNVSSIFPYTWRYVRESDYKNVTSTTASERTESAAYRRLFANAASYTAPTLFRLNHFVKLGVPYFSHRNINRAARILRKVDQYVESPDFGLPTFLALDSVEVGGGPTVVGALNDLCWTNSTPENCTLDLRVVKPRFDGLQNEQIPPQEIKLAPESDEVIIDPHSEL